MKFDLEAFKKAIDEDIANPNGYWNTIKKKEAVEKGRYDKFEKWLETNEFEPLFQKLLLRNGKERDDWCWKHNVQKYGTPMMLFLTGFIQDRRSQIINDMINSDFESGLWFFKGYYFQLNCGQGCFWRIYDRNLKIVEDV